LYADVPSNITSYILFHALFPYSSLLVSRLKDYSIASVASSHFSTTQQTVSPTLRSLHSTHPHTYNDGLSWADINALSTSSPSTMSTMSSDHSTMSLSSPFMRAFNTRAARDTWGGWSVAHAMLPEEAMATAPESLTWEHPERSSFSVVLAGVEYEAILTKSHRFIADKYSSQHQHWRDGARVTDTEPSASTRSSVVDCYYTGRLRELSPNPNTNTNTNTNTVSASPTRVHVSQANPAKAAVIAGSRVVVHMPRRIRRHIASRRSYLRYFPCHEPPLCSNTREGHGFP
jgi:hypothetical protein